METRPTSNLSSHEVSNNPSKENRHATVGRSGYFIAGYQFQEDEYRNVSVTAHLNRIYSFVESRDQNVGRIIHAGHAERGDGIGVSEAVNHIEKHLLITIQLIPRRRITIVHEPLLIATTIDLHHWNGSACGYIAHSHHPRRNRSRIHCEVSGAFAYEKEFTATGKGS